MYCLEERPIACPYCGEIIHLLLDVTEAGDDYIEDCQVCCQPIVIHFSTDEAGEIYITARSENDTC